jgi:predicted amidophosphoribosyltransferase
MEFDPFSPFGVFAILVFVFLTGFLVRTLRTRQQMDHRTLLECKACGATQPGFARFCRRCGKAL